MNGLLFRTRVAVLWVAVAIAASGSILLYLYLPGALPEMLTGTIEGDALDNATGLLLATLVVIPLVMAAVTLLVSDGSSRYINLFAGLAVGLLVAYAAVAELSAGDFDGHVLMTALAGALAFLVAVLGLVALRQPAGGGDTEI